MSIYLDHAATTPMFPAAVDAMLPFLRMDDANPSSPHTAGRKSRRAIDDARDSLAAFVHCLPGEVVFTSGGTEADNLAIQGAAANGVLVVSAIEHHAVLEPALARAARVVPVTRDGRIDLDALCDALDSSVGLVSVMGANNEVGTVQPLEEVCSIVRERAPQALLHCDAVQSLPWCVNSSADACDLVSISAHKFGGPKGVGALVVRDAARARIDALVRGGGQEGGLRAGTENVAGIVATGVAAEIWRRDQDAIVERVRALRDQLEFSLVDQGAVPRSARATRVASIAPLHFACVQTEELLMALDAAGLAASAGAACASGALEPSHVLLAMGYPASEIEGSIRLSLGWSTTAEEVVAASEIVRIALESLRRV